MRLIFAPKVFGESSTHRNLLDVQGGFGFGCVI